MLLPAVIVAALGVPAEAPAAKRHYGPSLGLPSPSKCKYRPRFMLRVRPPHGTRLRSARVFVDGHRVARLRGARLRRRFRLRGVPAHGAFTVRIVARTRDGRRLSARRRYRDCPAGTVLPDYAHLPMPGCADVKPGIEQGDWPMYSRDLSGDRNQTLEHRIGPDTAPALAPKFAFDVAAQGMDGIFQATPTVTNGCFYMGTSTGWVFAANADTGAVVWKTKLEVGDPGLLGVGVVGSAAVDSGKLFVIVSQDSAPYAAAFDQATGKLLWKSVLDDHEGAYNDASPVVYEGVVFAAFASDESKPTAHGGFALLDEDDGHLLARTYAIPDADYKNGFGGAGIWATPAIDTRTGYAFVGTGNPSTPKEHANTDAILKVDMERARPTFGQVVGSYKGTSEDLDTGTDANPACEAAGGANFYLGEVLCQHQDVDFGGSPQLFDVGGQQVVGELQKSGVYHVAHTADMTPAWKATVGAPAVITNGDTGATDGKRVYVVGTPPGQMMALEAADGSTAWTSPIGDQVHFQAVTYANGVVYTVDSAGNFRAWAAEDGAALLTRPLGPDTGPGGQPSYTGGSESTGSPGPSDTSASVSVARGRVYVAAAGNVVAYALP